MKKYIYLIGLFAYAMGTIGGIGYACYSGAWVIAVAVAILGTMAFSTAKKFYKKITE
jgi:uncharacterized membrane protein